MAVDEEGMFTLMGRRIVITPQTVLGTMFRAAADLGGINLAKVFMRNAGYEVAADISKTMIEAYKIEGENLITFYCETAGKRGWGFNVVEEIDGKNGIFKLDLYYSPFVTAFTEKTTTTVCDYLAGSVEGMFHAAGFKSIKIVETKCVAKGDDVCRFENK